MWYMYDMGSWLWFGAVWMFVFWAGIIAPVVWGINKFTKRDDSDSKPSPLDIVKGRYARGGISREEFEQIKKDLL
ncbi:SHOCT domain-containing protein [Chloroflexota bacterium]